jgi:precorrin-2 dehydrogenase/sirohydrochlorin ferrochelatase
MKAASYYPAFLDLSGRRCVVFGGGRVALRKVMMLLEFGGRVEVVSPELCTEVRELEANQSIGVRQRGYRPEDLDGALLAIAATDDRATNEHIAAAARDRGVLINVVDVPGLCDFIVPAYLRRGDLTIAVSTSGTGPALARKVRMRLENEFCEEYTVLSRLVGEVRSGLKLKGIRADGRVWDAALDLDSILELLRQGKEQEAKAMLAGALTNNGKVS